MKQLGTDLDWFTSDLHLGHKALLDRRMFDNVDDMDAAVVNSINDNVGENDRLYIIGDVSFHKWQYTGELMDRFRCKNLILIPGNHDSRTVEHWAHKFVKVQHLIRKTFKLIDAVTKGEVQVFATLCHDPVYVWDRIHYGALQLHGHSHGTCDYPSTARQLDVGWDVHRRPLSLVEVYEKLRGLPIPVRDHHEPKDLTNVQRYGDVLSGLMALHDKLASISTQDTKVYTYKNPESVLVTLDAAMHDLQEFLNSQADGRAEVDSM